MAGSSTYAKGVEIRLGLVAAHGNLKTVRRSVKDDAFKTLCPGCLPDAVRVEQRLTCAHGHGPYLPGECKDKGKEIDKELVALTAEEVEAIKAEGETDLVLHLNVHPASQVTAMVRQTGIAYWFQPEGSPEFVGVLLDLIDEPDLAFMGEATLRGKRKLFRLERAPFGLVLVELCRPEDLFSFEEVSYDYDPKYLEFALPLVQEMITDFDPEAYKSGTADRLAQVLAAKAEGAPTPKPTATIPRANDLEAALAASLAAVKQGKVA